MNKAILIILIISSILLFTLFKQENNLIVHFLDIGQGDCILIRTPAGQNILIDGGADNKPLSEIAKVLPWWDRTIDYIVITHYHADHMMALIELLNKYKVKQILVTDHQPDDLLYRTWSEKLAEYNLEATVVQAGQTFIIEDNLSWQIIIADGYHKDYNDNSIVIRLSFKDIDYLFTGDLPTVQEKRILNTNLVLESEILKVAHHGSKYSSSQAWLQAINPELCVIQSGEDNKFGHPHQEAVDRFKGIDCQIKDNQVDSTIIVVSDGQSWWLTE